MEAEMEATSELTLQEIRRIVPFIDRLIRRAARERRPGWRDYERYKRLARDYVGWYSGHREVPELMTSRAYELVINGLLEALRL
jgi:hypothetical protein